jgi:hypothetical protein
MRYMAVTTNNDGTWKIIGDEFSSYYDAVMSAEAMAPGQWALIAKVVNERDSWSGDWSDPKHLEELG